MRLACWRTRPRDRGLSFALHFFPFDHVFSKSVFRRDAAATTRSDGQAFKPARETHALPTAREPRMRRDFQIDGE